MILTRHIKDKNVTAEKIADKAITANQIADNTIIPSKLALPRIIQAGKVTPGVVNKLSGKSVTVSGNFGTTNYAVFLTHAAAPSSYTAVNFATKNRAASSFIIDVWNDSDSANVSPEIFYLVVGLS